jgi:hypothetical protein
MARNTLLGVYIHHIFIIHSSIDGHLGWFHNLAPFSGFSYVTRHTPFLRGICWIQLISHPLINGMPGIRCWTISQLYSQDIGELIHSMVLKNYLCSDDSQFSIWSLGLSSKPQTLTPVYPTTSFWYLQATQAYVPVNEFLSPSLNLFPTTQNKFLSVLGFLHKWDVPPHPKFGLDAGTNDATQNTTKVWWDLLLKWSNFTEKDQGCNQVSKWLQREAKREALAFIVIKE